MTNLIVVILCHAAAVARVKLYTPFMATVVVFLIVGSMIGTNVAGERAVSVVPTRSTLHWRAVAQLEIAG